MFRAEGKRKKDLAYAALYSLTATGTRGASGLMQ